MRKRLTAVIVAIMLAVGLTPALAWSFPLEAVDVDADQGDLEPALLIDLANAEIGPIAPRVYTGSAIEPELDVTLDGRSLAKGDDYSVSWRNNTNAGEATGVLSGEGSYTGSVSVSFRVEPAAITSISLSTSTCTYNGKVRSPKVAVKCGSRKLKASADYKLTTPKGRKNQGVYTYKVKGCNNYKGVKTARLQIKRASIAKASAAKIGAKTYTAKAQRPLPTLKFAKKKLKKGSDYRLAYSKNIKKGTAKITVTGRGNFTGTEKLSFKIKAASLSKRARVSGIKAKTYSGRALTQNPTVKLGNARLKRGTDYTLSYRNNVSAGTATVIVKGKGSCTGSLRKTFRISPRSISSASVGYIPDYARTGGAIEPDPSVWFGGRRLARNVDYWLSYRNNVGSGTATVVVHGMGNYRSSTSEDFWIYGIYITRTGECYHRDGCSSLSRSRIPISLWEAQAGGFRACHNCRP